MHKAPQHLTRLVRRAVEPMGFELVGVEYLSRPTSGHLLRVYIDSEDGIGLSDCEKVSHQVSGVLDVEDPIHGAYALEVSSPGLDRPLFERAHFERAVGQVVRIRMHAPVDGRANYKGRLLQVAGDGFDLEVDGARITLPLGEVASARLVPDL